MNKSNTLYSLWLAALFTTATQQSCQQDVYAQDLPKTEMAMLGAGEHSTTHALDTLHLDGHEDTVLMLRDGGYASYHTNGSIKEIAYYKNGELHGLQESYFENGQLHYRAEYKNGVRTGVYKEFFDNGQLRLTVTFADNGEKISLVEYGQDGSLEDRQVNQDYIAGPPDPAKE